MKIIQLFILFFVILQQIDAKNNNDYFEATQSATAASVKVARQKALLHAKNLLATMVNGKVVNVAKAYIDNNSLKETSLDEFVTETQTIAIVTLNGAEIFNESVIQEKKKNVINYTVKITLRLSKSKVLGLLCDKLSLNPVISEKFNKENFESEWNKY